MARTARYVSSSGTDTYANSTSASTPMSWATAIANASAGDDIWVKADGTYSRTTTADAPPNSGTAANPIRFVGYQTTTGDGYLGRTNGNGPLITTNFPTITYTTGRLNISSRTNWILENLNISAASNNDTVQQLTHGLSIQCSFSNSGTGGASATAWKGINNASLINSDVSVTCATALAGIYASGGTQLIYGCRSTCTNGPAVLSNNGGNVVAFCTLYSSSVGIRLGSDTSTYLMSLNNTFYSITNDCIEVLNSATATNRPIIINSMATDSGRFLNSLYAGTGNLAALLYYSRTRDNTNANAGFPDWPTYGDVTTDTGAAATDYVDAAGGDFRLISASPAKGAGIPPYLDSGALQRQETASGGSIIRTGMNGGFL